MRAPYSLSCLFLLSLGACIPPGERWEPAEPGEGAALGGGWQRAAEGRGPGWRAGARRRRSEELDELLSITRGPGWRAGARRRRSEELEALLSIARELRGYSAAGAGQRPGGSGGPGALPVVGEKRSGTLGNLAEEINGYNRRKGGFTFRFGR
ncbi:orexigenic neuropeptide QRFP precursor [Taeniopygia guttata]|uniref:26RFa protein n=1 Tax=Taeniopygia guttata TaxID=59729 RepID=F5HPR8_TAEGU|nr:orexigenic neuropeptide QRFP precursor [Taeniopygia guttata]BAK32798.1 26RFa precursor protein [Taeniopygia guttata]